MSQVAHRHGDVAAGRHRSLAIDYTRLGKREWVTIDLIHDQTDRTAVSAETAIAHPSGGEGPYCWITEKLRLVASTFGIAEGGG